jgi:hypothetical protein
LADPAEVIRGLRSRIFSLSAKDVKGAPLPSGVFGALMEFSAGQTWVSLVAIMDGGTSLYFGTGGGIIGAGGKEPVRVANRLFLETAGRFVSEFAKVTEYPAPKPGCVRFYVLMSDGVHASEEMDEFALQSAGNHFLPLYAAAQNVITHIRLSQAKP